MSAADTLQREQARTGREALELAMLQHLKALKLDAGMQREWRFCERGWRFDFAWPTRQVALEVEGGTFSGGRHTRGSGFAEDCDKYNRAALMGWRVLRATGGHVRSGKAASWIAQALEARTE